VLDAPDAGSRKPQRSFNVLVKDGRIVSVSPKAVDVHEAAVIDVGGRTSMSTRPPSSTSAAGR
jgi:imidazolonepropionase-like amidohydrolase